MPNKRNGGTRRQNLTAARTLVEPPADDLVVEAYRWEADRFVRYQLRSNGKLSRVEISGRATEVTAPAGGRISGISRFDFYSRKTKRLLLRLDTIGPNPGPAAASRSTLEMRGTDITVNAAVRCVLWTMKEQAIQLQVKLSPRSSELMYTEFRVNNERFNINGDWDAVLEKFETNIDAPFTSRDTIGFPYFLGLIPAPILVCARPLTVSFTPVSNITGEKLDWRVIRFTRRFDGSCKSKVEDFKTFYGPENNLNFTNPGLTLVQLPSRDINSDPKLPLRGPVPPTKWIVRVDGIPFGGAADLWNRFADRYYKSIRTVEGGRPVSFLPELDLKDVMPATDWGMAYSLIDSLTEKESEDFEYRFSDDSAKRSKPTIEVAGVSLQPKCPTDTQAAAPLQVSLRQLKTHENEPLPVQLKLLSTPMDPTGKCVFNESRFEDEAYKGIVLPLDDLVRNSKAGGASVRMGSLDLQFTRGTKDDAKGKPKNDAKGKPEPPPEANKVLTSFFRIVPRQDVYSVHIKASFSISRISPGGQDDVPLSEAVPDGGGTDSAGSNCTLDPDYRTVNDKNERTFNEKSPDFERKLEQHFRRQSPLVIDLGEQKPGSAAKGAASPAPPPIEQPARFTLEVTEDAQENGSQTVIMTLLSQAGGGQSGQNKNSVIVMDSNPFLVAKVEYPPFLAQSMNGGATIAEWRSRGLEGANWEVRSQRQDFDLCLPPQGVGEEMEKRQTIAENKPIDFRLAPPADFKLRPSENPQNLTEVPWNLRRVLGYPGQRNAGAGVVHLQFEMLYGLTCDVNYPFLRLAEIAALVGAVPGRLPPTPRWSHANRESYKRARSDWAILYRRYLARLAVLQPWDTHRLPDEFKSSDPPKNDLLLGADPQRNKDVVCRIRVPKDKEDKVVAELANPLNPEADKLKGGVTWGIESANVYNVIIDNPVSNEATVTDPFFSGLGGWGKLRASFNNKLSTVYADVSMGRTYSYKLERLGRICAWWNLAKHVIVYERTVAPAPRMSGQNALLGRPVLRKVREYIEILEMTRRFPDGKSAEAVPPAQRGCVTACTFNKKEYDVDSSWGSDVGTIGWKIQLWNPGAPADLFPKPEVCLEIASQVGGKTAPVPWYFKDPEKLYFYTETKSDSDSNPHEWLPVDDLDYVDLPMCRPMEDFQQGRPEISTPDDPAVHPGYGPCTFTLEPGPGPADLVAGRADAGKPMVAQIETITMMRARLRDYKDGEAALPQMAQDILKLRENVIKAYQKILEAAPSDDPQMYASLIETLKTKGAAEFSDLQKVLDRVKSAGDKALSLIDNREADLQNLLKGQWNKLQDEVKKGYTDAAARISAATANNLKKLEQLKLAADHAVNAIQERLVLLRLSPGLLPRMLRRYYDAASRLESELREKVLAIKEELLKSFPDKIVGDQLIILENSVRRLLARADELLQSVNHQRPLEDWIPDLSTAISARDDLQVGSLKKDYEQKRKALVDTVLDKKEVLKADAEKVLAAFEVMNCDLRNLGAKSEPILANWVEDKVKELEKFRTDLLQKISGDFEQARTMVSQEFDTRLKALETELTKDKGKITEVADQVKALRDLVTEDLTKGLPSFSKDEINRRIDKSRAEIEKYRDEVLSGVDSYVQKTVRLALGKGADAVKSVFAEPGMSIRLLRAFGKAPEVKNLEFPGRKQVAYFYSSLEGAVEMTRSLSQVKQPSDISKALEPIGIKMPTKELLDRLIPPDLRHFNLSEIFPNFAGLDLRNLFNNLRMPEAGENVRVSHGVDPQSGRAWVETTVNIITKEPATIFTIGPVVLRLPSAHFEGKLRIEAGRNQSLQRTVQGSITGDFDLVIADMLLVKFKDTTLSFDDRGGLRFNLSPKNVVLPDLLSFVSQFLGAVGGSDSGFSVKFLKDGVEALLVVPVPDTAGVTSGIANLKLGVAFRLTVDPFKICVVFSLGRHDAPFTITGFLLGGAGYIEVAVCYIPEKRQFSCEVEVAVAMSGSVAIAVGPINGGVYIYFGIKNIFKRFTNGGDSVLTMGAFLLFIGKVQLLGIVEVEISELLEVKYTAGKLTGHGRLSLKIKICWCFTLEVAADLEYTLGEGTKTSTEKNIGALQNQRPMIAGRRPVGHPTTADGTGYYITAGLEEVPGERAVSSAEGGRTGGTPIRQSSGQAAPAERPINYYKPAITYIEMLI